MTDKDEQVVEGLVLVKKAQQAVMVEAMLNTILGQVVFKTGRTSYATQEDFLKYHLEVLRDQIMATSFCAMATFLLKEGLSSGAKETIQMLIDVSNEQLIKSSSKFKNLCEHLREEHTQELSNELARVANAARTERK